MQAAVARALEGFSRNRKFLVGVSGGRDSMALLHAIRSMGYNNLVVCHLDHGLRGKESRADAAFVRRAAKGLKSESAKVRAAEHAKARKFSLELAARELRQQFFRECASRHRCRTLLIAHHADDQIETCLFQFLRGSGAAGLAGMKPAGKLGALTVLRPLLGVWREEIEEYVKKNAIPFREDATNTAAAHTRNRIRHDMIPAIRAAVGDRFRAAILRAADIFRVEDAWLESQVPGPAAELSCKILREMPEAVRRRAVLRWLHARGVPEPGYAETLRVLALLDPEEGPAKVSLPGRLHARRRAGRIFIGRERVRG